MYECLCNCGKTIIRSSEYLKTKKAASCSVECRRNATPSLIGTKINKLTVLNGPLSSNSDGSICWECLCDCGSKLKVNNSRLIKGLAISCSRCASTDTIIKFNSKRIEPHNKMKPGEAAFNDLYGRYKKNAKNRQYAFDLTKEEFKVLTKELCFYCGALPTKQYPSKEAEHKLNEMGKRVNGFYVYNGIDRKNNSKGYSIDNCVTCCSTCNDK